MVLEERKGDLFSCTDTDVFMQCVSADFACGAGIALQFNNAFNVKRLLQNTINGMDYWGKVKGFAVITGENSNLTPVINLVTKERCFYKPTLKTLHSALYGAKLLCDERGFKTIAMPHIGSGLDKLNFYCQVLPIIKQVFAEDYYKIIVYEL